MKFIAFALTLSLSSPAFAWWGGSQEDTSRLLGPRNINVILTINGVRTAQSARYLTMGEIRPLKANDSSVGFPAIDVHPTSHGSLGYVRIGFSKPDPKTGARSGDFVGFARFLSAISSSEYYVDQMEIGPNISEGTISVPGLGADFYDIAKICVRYQYLEWIPSQNKLEKRSVFLLGSTLAKQDTEILSKRPIPNECEIKPVN